MQQYTWEYKCLFHILISFVFNMDPCLNYFSLLAETKYLTKLKKGLFSSQLAGFQSVVSWFQGRATSWSGILEKAAHDRQEAERSSSSLLFCCIRGINLQVGAIHTHSGLLSSVNPFTHILKYTEAISRLI